MAAGWPSSDMMGHQDKESEVFIFLQKHFANGRKADVQGTD